MARRKHRKISRDTPPVESLEEKEQSVSAGAKVESAPKPTPEPETPKEVSSKPSRTRVKYREIVYVGTADKSVVIGAVTGKRYEFFKNEYRMPMPTKIDERDYPGIIALKGKGCVRRDPAALYISKLDWDLELKAARASNR